MSKTDSQPDLAWLRDVAEAGVRAPSLGGRFYVLWGALTALMMLTHWAALNGMTPFPIQQIGLFWLGYVIAGGALSFVFGRMISGKPGAGSAGNRVEGAVWTAAGAGIALYALGCAIAAGFYGASPFIFDTIIAVALYGYAVAFAVTAAAAGRRWMFAPAGVSLLCAAAAPALFGRPELYLLAAAAMFLAVFLPGLALMRGEPRAQA
ncbi:MAG: hypothetical protein KIS81_06605 [Maricaulaceae bacterium]|nr:hypothetical protein [Maricaulaceae bacterium]